jgi:hypothetical protein
MGQELSIPLEKIWIWKNYHFENVDIAKINRQIQLETRFTLSGRKRSGKGKQTTLSDFVN